MQIASLMPAGMSRNPSEALEQPQRWYRLPQLPLLPSVNCWRPEESWRRNRKSRVPSVRPARRQLKQCSKVNKSGGFCDLSPSWCLHHCPSYTGGPEPVCFCPSTKESLIFNRATSCRDGLDRVMTDTSGLHAILAIKQQVVARNSETQAGIHVNRVAPTWSPSLCQS